MPETARVALARAASYAQPDLDDTIGNLLDATSIGLAPGLQVLVKPNLLMAHALSCTTPAIVAGVCKWLLDHHCHLTISDSPAFGTAAHVARAIGLENALKPLGLKVTNFTKPRKISLLPCASGPVPAYVAPEALDCDMIFSLPRIKAHSQLRLTLAVKNCFGCICGIHKMLAHAPRNLSLEIFTDRVAALWAALPPVAALCDGILTMAGTGPRNGFPFQLGILGASASAPALDNSLVQILGLEPGEIPLCEAMRRRAGAGEARAWPTPVYTLLQPAEVMAQTFPVPRTLKNISFNPLTLFKSTIRRLWQGR